MQKKLIKFALLLILPTIIINICLANCEVISLDDLNVKIENYNPTISVMQYNVDKAVIEEKYENTKWQNRSPRIMKLIKEVDADIACLQEMRELPNNVSDAQFLSSLNNYRFFMWYKNPTQAAFGQAIIYKYEKLFPVKCFPLWFSDTPEEVSDNWCPFAGSAFGSMILCARFVHIYNGKVVKNLPGIWVFNVHFPTRPEIVKEKCCRKLIELVKSITKGEPFIICGDFNLFFDMDGIKHKDILIKELIDLCANQQTLSGKKIEGTFVGFEHDKFKADLTKLTNRLDYIFGSEYVIKIDDALVYTKTMLEPEPLELTTRDYPSDHLPLVIKLKFCNLEMKNNLIRAYLKDIEDVTSLPFVVRKLIAEFTGLI